MSPQEFTPTLDDWLQQRESDDNLFWRTGLGDLKNLMEEAIERMSLAERRLRALEDRS